MSTNPPCPLRPGKIVKQADSIMDQVHALYDKYGEIMEPTDRTLAESKMVMADDFRQSVEERSWLAKRTPAKLYLNQAQGALETVKKSVDET